MSGVDRRAEVCGAERIQRELGARPPDVRSPATARALALGDVVLPSRDLGPFGAPAVPLGPPAGFDAAARALALPVAARTVIAPGLARAALALEGAARAAGAARTALTADAGESLRVRFAMRQAGAWLSKAGPAIAAARVTLPREAALGPRAWDGVETTRGALGLAREQLAAAHGELDAARARARSRGVGTALRELRQAQQAAAAADAELQMAAARGRALEAPAASGPVLAGGDADLARIGTALDPQRPPAQTLWNENMVNRVSLEGRRQGGLSEAQGGRNAEVARALLGPEVGEAARALGVVDLVAALRQAGEPALERLDPGQLVAAVRYLNSATSLADQQEKLRKVLDNFQVLDRIGLPKLPRAELMGQLELHARVPGKATSKLKDAELLTKFQEIVATLNGGGELRTNVGKHKLELQVSQDGQILKAKCKKPGFWSKVAGFLKKALPVVLTVASFIPVTATFARVASAVMSAVKAKSVLGIAGAAAGLVGAGVAAFASKAASVAGSAANRIATVANAASRTLNGIQAVRQGSVLGGIAGIAGAVAGGVSSVASSFGAGLERFADGLNRWAGRAAAGFLAADAARRGDLFGAAGLGASLAADFTGAKADAWLSRVGGGAARAGAVQAAIQRGDYLGAASGLSGLAAGLAGRGAAVELERLAATLGQMGTAHQLIRTRDYLGAASALTAAAGSYVGSASTRQRLDEVAGHLMRAGQAHVRAASGDYLGASSALTRLVSGFGWDDRTKGQLDKAAEVFRRASGIDGALAAGDYLGASALLAEVGGLFSAERKVGFTGASDLLARMVPAYERMRRGDYSGAAAILTPLAIDGRLWPFGGRSPLQGTTELVQALAGVRAALSSGDYAAAARSLATVQLTGGESQETLRLARAALETLGRVKGALESRDVRRADGAAAELSRYEHLLAGTPLASALRDFRRALSGSDPVRPATAAQALGQALAAGASALLRPLEAVLQAEAKGALGEQVRFLTNPEALAPFALGVAGVGVAGRAVIEPTRLARELTPDVARRLGLPWPLDPGKLTPEQVAKLKQLGEDKSFLESIQDSAKSWTWSDIGHTGLDVVGLVPGFGEAADVANAAWYVAEAKYLDAGLSLISVIPVVGDVIGKGGKLAKRLGGDAAQRLLTALQRVDVVKFLDQFKTHPKLGPYVTQIQDTVGKWVDELEGAHATRPRTTLSPKPGTLSADGANAAHVAAGRRPPYAAGTRVREIILSKDQSFVRVHGEGNQARSWMMRPDEIAGLSPAQIKERFALPELPKFVSEVHVPKGTRVRVGTVGSQAGWGGGGGTQYELLDRLPEAAFKNRRVLE